MSTVPFVTCDLLDDNPEKICKWSHHQWTVSSLKVMAHANFWRTSCKCFEDNSRVKELLATDGTGRYWLGMASTALMGDMIAGISC